MLSQCCLIVVTRLSLIRLKVFSNLSQSSPIVVLKSFQSCLKTFPKLSSKIYGADFGNFKQGFLSMKLIQKSNFRVQGMFFQQLYWEKSKQCNRLGDCKCQSSSEEVLCYDFRHTGGILPRSDEHEMFLLLAQPLTITVSFCLQVSHITRKWHYHCQLEIYIPVAASTSNR